MNPKETPTSILMNSKKILKFKEKILKDLK